MSPKARCTDIALFLGAGVNDIDRVSYSNSLRGPSLHCSRHSDAVCSDAEAYTGNKQQFNNNSAFSLFLCSARISNANGINADKVC